MIKKILALFIIVSSLSATVFDYRIYYGQTTSIDKKIGAASATIYSYPFDNDLSFGAQGFAERVSKKNKKYLSTGSLVLGYDLSRIMHAEINGGVSAIFQHGKYKKGYSGSGTILVQTNLESFLDALQVGFTYKRDVFKKEQDENGYFFFLGFGF